MLSFRSVSKLHQTRQGERRVLDEVCLEVLAGESVALVGAAGAGKSTLLALAGLLEPPTTGTITFDGADTQALSADRRARLRGHDIGFVFAEPFLLPHLSLLDNLMLAAGPGDAERDVGDRARALLAAVALDGRAALGPDDLTPAEQHRGAMARAFMRSPRLVVVDDFGARLPEALTSTLIDLLMRLHARHTGALLAASRDPSMAHRLDRQVTLRDGRLEEG